MKEQNIWNSLIYKISTGFLLFSKRQRERDFANVSGPPTSMTVHRSWTFLSVKRFMTVFYSCKGHKRSLNGQERPRKFEPERSNGFERMRTFTVHSRSRFKNERNFGVYRSSGGIFLRTYDSFLSIQGQNGIFEIVWDHFSPSFYEQPLF